MPIREVHPQVVRTIECLRGQVEVRMELCIRFGYGEVVPWVTRCENLLTGTAGPDSVALWTLAETRGEDMKTVAQFTLTEGQYMPFVLSWYLSHELPPRPVDPWYSIETTSAWWRAWSAGCSYDREEEDAVIRSLITLKALTYEPTGGIVAAADDVVARGDRRQPQLGLPLLLAARRHVHPRVAHARRVSRGGDGLARLAPAGGLRRRLASCRSCTARTASGGWTSGRSTGSPGTRTPGRCASATRRRASSSWTCTARSWTPCSPRVSSTE